MKSELRETLRRLHEELGATQEMDAELRQELEQTLEELRGRLEATEDTETQEGGEGSAGGLLSEKLESLALRFEQSHPVLAEGLGSAIQTLARMGI